VPAVITGTLQYLSPALYLYNRVSQIIGLIKGKQGKMGISGKKAVSWSRRRFVMSK
jgi:hypothetical protein